MAAKSPRIPGRVWTFMENIKDTAFDFVLVLRQMHTEDILRDKLRSVGAVYYESTECTDFELEDEMNSSDTHLVKSYFTNTKTQKKSVLRR